MCITYEYIHLQTVAYYAVIILVLVPGLLSPVTTQAIHRHRRGGTAQDSEGRDISASSVPREGNQMNYTSGVSIGVGPSA